jgi:hypothetical protein
MITSNYCFRYDIIVIGKNYFNFFSFLYLSFILLNIPKSFSIPHQNNVCKNAKNKIEIKNEKTRKRKSDFDFK